MKITLASDAAAPSDEHVVRLKNDIDPRSIALDQVRVVELEFPKFTDGRAFSQAYLLRRRMGFRGEIRATGDVLVDQLLQMKRSGFDAAVLRADQDLQQAKVQLAFFNQFYQGDATSKVARSNAGVAA
jgi:uncharacterized protein (DUF934 family)